MKLSNLNIPYFLIIASGIVLVLSPIINGFTENSIQSLKHRFILKHALQDYREAEDHGASSSIMCKRLVDLASAYSKMGDRQNTEKYRRKVLELFLKQDLEEIDEEQLNETLNTIQSLADPKHHKLVKSCIQKAINLSERRFAFNMNRDNEQSDINTTIEKVLPVNEKTELLKSWIALREKYSGSRNEHLAFLYSLLAKHYESQNKIEHAEKALSKTLSLDYHNPNNKLNSEIQAAWFYTRIGKLKIVQPLCLDILDKNKWGQYSNTNHRISSVLSIYKHLGLDAELNTAISALLDDPTRDAFKTIDTFLVPKISLLISEGKYSEAEILVRKRINAGSEYPHTDVRGHWKLTLSNILLAQQKPNESEMYFREVLNSRLLRDESVMELAKDRIQEARKYALAE